MKKHWFTTENEKIKKSDCPQPLFEESDIKPIPNGLAKKNEPFNKAMHTLKFHGCSHYSISFRPYDRSNMCYIGYSGYRPVEINSVYQVYYSAYMQNDVYANLTLSEVKARVDEKINLADQGITIVDESGKEVARRQLYSVRNKGKGIISIGEDGWLGEWEDLVHDLANAIKEARTIKGFKQREVGEALGYDGDSAQVTVARWEAGTRPIPSDKIRELCKLLDLDPLIFIP